MTLYTQKEIAAILGWTPRRLNYHCRQGQIEKPAARRYYTAEQVEKIKDWYREYAASRGYSELAK